MADIRLNDVSLTIHSKPAPWSTTNDISVLHNISAVIRQGELTALMGASGSGKTTLLNLLASRMQSTKHTTTGTIDYYHRPTRTHYAHQDAAVKTAYVTQTDFLIPHYTVLETLTFAANMSLPTTMSTSEKAQVVCDLIAELGLKDCQHSLIGNDMLIGCSGGEKRRVSIAVQLLTNPSVLFLDEPTTGLDSFTAFNIFTTLRHLCRSRHITVVISVHQPRSDIFNMFDSVLLLAKGHTLYSGSKADMHSYFDSVCVPCEPQKNMGDHFIDVSSIDTRTEVAEELSRAQVDVMIRSWAVYARDHTHNNNDQVNNNDQNNEANDRSDMRVENQDSPTTTQSTPLSAVSHDLNEPFLTSSTTRVNTSTTTPTHSLASTDSGPSFFTQVWLLYKRFFSSLIRDKLLIFGSCVQSFTITLFVSLVYIQLTGSPDDMRARVSLLYISATLIPYVTLVFQIYIQIKELVIYDHEKKEGRYSASAYLVARWLLHAPVMCVVAFIVATALRNATNLRDTPLTHHWQFVGIELFPVLYVLSLSTLVTAMSRSFAIASLIANTIFTFSCLGSGFFIKATTLPVFLLWVRKISYIYYTLTALAANEFTDHIYDCPVKASLPDGDINNPMCWLWNGNRILQDLAIDRNNIFEPLMIMMGIIVGLYLLAIIVLTLWSPSESLATGKIDSQSTISHTNAGIKLSLRDYCVDVVRSDVATDLKSNPTDSDKSASTEHMRTQQDSLVGEGEWWEDDVVDVLRDIHTCHASDLTKDRCDTPFASNNGSIIHHTFNTMSKTARIPVYLSLISKGLYVSKHTSLVSRLTSMCCAKRERNDDHIDVYLDTLTRAQSGSNHCHDVKADHAVSASSPSPSSPLSPSAKFDSSFKSLQDEGAFYHSLLTQPFSQTLFQTDDTNVRTSMSTSDLNSSVSVSQSIDKDNAVFARLNTNADGHPVLIKQVTQTMKPGQLWAIMGGSGSGKSSLLNLLCGVIGFNGVYKQCGEVCVNDMVIGYQNRGELVMVDSNTHTHANTGGDVSIDTLPAINTDVVTHTSGHSQQGSFAYTDYGKTSDVSLIYRYLGLVSQQDHLLSSLTVYETLIYAARLRLPSALSENALAQRVNSLLLELGLKDCAHNVVGSETCKGISGGEKRRLSIGIQLLSDPSVLLLDEPTSGLDSFTAYYVCEMLKALSMKGRCVIVTLHQPRLDIYNLFDYVCLLSKSNVIFSGPRSYIPTYFSSLPFVPTCTHTTNICDWLLDVTSIDNRSVEVECVTKLRVLVLAKIYEQRRRLRVIRGRRRHQLNSGVESGGVVDAECNVSSDVIVANTVTVTVAAIDSTTLTLNTHPQIITESGVTDREEVVVCEHCHVYCSLKSLTLPCRPISLDNYSRAVQLKPQVHVEDRVQMTAGLTHVHAFSCDERSKARLHSFVRVCVNTSVGNPHDTVLDECVQYNSDSDSEKPTTSVSDAVVSNNIVEQSQSQGQDVHIDMNATSLSLYSQTVRSASFSKAFVLLFSRSLKNLVRQPELLMARFSQIVSFGILICLFFMNLSHTQSGVSNRIGFMTMSLSIVSVGMLNAIAIFPPERDVFYRETQSKLYSALPFFVCHLCTEFLCVVFAIFCFAIVSIYLVGIISTVNATNFFLFTYVLFCGVIQGETLGLLFASLVSHVGFAVSLVSTIITFMDTMAGFLAVNSNIWVPLRYINYIFPHRYMARIVGIISMQHQQFHCTSQETLPDGTCIYTSGEQILDYLEFDASMLYWYVLILGLLTIAFRLAVLVALHVHRPVPRTE